MNEQQRSEYMAIVAASVDSDIPYDLQLKDVSDAIAENSMRIWIAANKAANEAKP